MKSMIPHDKMIKQALLSYTRRHRPSYIAILMGGNWVGIDDKRNAFFVGGKKKYQLNGAKLDDLSYDFLKGVQYGTCE